MAPDGSPSTYSLSYRLLLGSLRLRSSGVRGRDVASKSMGARASSAFRVLSNCHPSLFICCCNWLWLQRLARTCDKTKRLPLRKDMMTKRTKQYTCNNNIKLGTLGTRDFSMRGFRLLSKPAIRDFGLRPKICRSLADTEVSSRTREKPLVPRVQTWQSIKKCIQYFIDIHSHTIVCR